MSISFLPVALLLLVHFLEKVILLKSTQSILSEETLRQRMDDVGDSLHETILNEDVELLISNKIQ